MYFSGSSLVTTIAAMNTYIDGVLFPSYLLAGDVVNANITPTSIVFAVILSVLGGWTSLILIEEVLLLRSQVNTHSLIFCYSFAHLTLIHYYDIHIINVNPIPIIDGGSSNKTANEFISCVDWFSIRVNGNVYHLVRFLAQRQSFARWYSR
jgi:hypothetical protein